MKKIVTFSSSTVPAMLALSASLLLLTTVLTSCGRKDSSFAMAESYSGGTASAKVATAASQSRFYQDSGVMVEEDALEAPAPEASPAYERKLILRGNINLEVASLDEARTATEQMVSQLGGYISNSSEWSNGISITIRIPSESFSQAMNSVSGIVKIRSKNIDSSDVTDQ